MISTIRILRRLPLPQHPIQDVLKTFRIHTSAVSRLKEITVQQEGNKKIIEASLKPSGREPHLLKTEHDDHACPVCRLNVDIKHTDVLILSQFVRKDGLMLPRRVTGLCKKSQRTISTLVSMAHIAGLMPNRVPFYSKPNCFQKRRDWKKYNTYFDENTIKIRDRFHKDKTGLKEAFYKKMGAQWEEVPPMNSPPIDLSTKKLMFY